MSQIMIGNRMRIILKEETKQEYAQRIAAGGIVEGVIRTSEIPSVNSMYIVSHGRKTLRSGLTQLRMNFFSQLQLLGFQQGSLASHPKLRIEYGFYFNKSRTFNSSDVDNRIKFFQDTLALFFGFNDNSIYEISAFKRFVPDQLTNLIYFRIGSSLTDDKTVRLNS